MCNILLVDMNSFYASVHQALDSSLLGKPVVVCGDPQKRHGIVLAASYEAKRYGIKTAMPKWEAQSLLREAIFIQPDYKQYLSFSTRIINILRDYSPLVEQFSIDEAYVDVSGTQSLFGSNIDIAKKIKTQIYEQLGILCSVGIGPNKLVAKMAAELVKPDGLTVITEKDVKEKLWPLPIKDLFGVGSRTEKKLRNLGVHTIGNLAQYPVEILQKKFGVVGQRLCLSANGIDYSQVNPNSHSNVKSIGNQLTLRHDYANEEIKVAILDLTEKVAYRVRQGGYAGKTITLVLRDPDFITHSWSGSLGEPTDITEEILTMAIKLFENHWSKGQKVRLVGVSVSNLQKKQYEQLDLFKSKENHRRLNRTCDQIRQKFGNNSIVRCTSLTENGIFNDIKQS